MLSYQSVVYTEWLNLKTKRAIPMVYIQPFVDSAIVLIWPSPVLLRRRSDSIVSRYNTITDRFEIPGGAPFDPDLSPGFKPGARNRRPLWVE